MTKIQGREQDNAPAAGPVQGEREQNGGGLGSDWLAGKQVTYLTEDRGGRVEGERMRVSQGGRRRPRRRR